MDTSNSSKTAEYMAFFRALETTRGNDQSVCTDRLAAGFVSSRGLRFVLGIAHFNFGRRLAFDVLDKKWPGARASGIARTRLIDGLLSDALADGFNQVVILGAGFDSRAFRIPGISQATVFEVDHPATLAEKRRRLARTGAMAPPNLRFAEIDFNKQSLPDVLLASGYDPSAKAFFIWEGVTNYLSEDAVDATLRYLGGTKPGNRIVFTYVHKEILEEIKDPSHQSLSQTLNRAGEPWTFGFYPEELPQYLGDRSLKLIEDIGSVAYRARYMGAAPGVLKGYEFYRVAVAEVAEEAGSDVA
jgi:methyltransferase (TIGR00027 family)